MNPELISAEQAPATPIFKVRSTAAEDDLKTAPSDLTELATLNGFTGKSGEILRHQEAVLLGVGDGSDPFVAAVAASQLSSGDYSFADTPANGQDGLAADLLGWLLGGYRFDRYRSETKKEEKPAAARLLAPKGADIEGARRAALATALARDLISTPAEDMSPVHLEAEARRVAEAHGADIAVIEGDALLAQNFPMIHAVGRAASAAPRLIDIRWGEPNARKVTLVGKGVTFDTGGLNLKSGAGMGLMKKDMGGAANTLALAQMIMTAGLPLRLRVLIPAVENSISGSSFRPSDILRSRKGLTVEIGNTDAEGRLVLADALDYAAEENPDVTISLATLTGAARVALGPDLPPFYCDDDAFAMSVATSADQVHDPLWRMPLWAPYAKNLSSRVADLNNITNDSFAGSVTAALFLKRFAPTTGVWAHLDIYGWRPKAAPGRPIGGEAQTIRALFDTLKKEK